MEWLIHQCDRCGKREQSPKSESDKGKKPDGWTCLDSLKGKADLCGECAILVLEFIETKEDTKTSLKKMIESNCKELMRRAEENSHMSGMLSDICEQIFGDNSCGAPKILAYQRSTWVCGPMVKTKDTFLEESGSDKDPEWDDFLLSLPKSRIGQD